MAEEKNSEHLESTRALLSVFDEKRKALLDELDDLLGQVGGDYGTVLLEELQNRLENITENFYDEADALFKDAFKKRQYQYEQLNELLSSGVKINKQQAAPVKSEDSSTPSFLKSLDLGLEKHNK